MAHEHLHNQLAEKLGGWAGLEGDAAEEMAELEFQQQLDHATIFRQVFAGPNGDYVLKSLVYKYMRQRIVRPDDSQFAAGIRQGQWDVVADLLFLIEFANTGGGRPTGAGAESEE